ncbi:ISAs1 family transposase [Candidatus Methylobacter oryzae]|uniref:ISAs1 family transposase n=1 Tax=Candidatus Methylobacter oryzae TaxID=2497749 RepID=UPI00240D1F73|nr:ISAs1 family transposase [Candidatus Methylobacter oryzae]
MLLNPLPYFQTIKDPRRETKNKLHKLSDILLIVLCAVLSGIEDWVGMEEFAEEKEPWLRRFLELPNGMPSHDTLSDVLGRIDPNAFQEAFLQWVEAALPSLLGEQIYLDDKTLRGSRVGDSTVPLLSAYAAKARWVLGRQAVGEKTNEITAIPNLLSMLDIAGSTVSIDAMGCQKNIAQSIRRCQGRLP